MAPGCGDKSGQGFSHFNGLVWVKKLVQESRICLAIWNIRPLGGKGKELVDMIIRRINIGGLQETKWVGEKFREIENTRYKICCFVYVFPSVGGQGSFFFTNCNLSFYFY